MTRPPKDSNRGELPGRILLGLLGAGLIVVPLVVLGGWNLVCAMPLILIGAVLAVLSAFYSRINGYLVFRWIQIPIGPPLLPLPSEARDEGDDPRQRSDGRPQMGWRSLLRKWFVVLLGLLGRGVR